MPSYIAVLDFEANCIDGKILRPQEIIEFPTVIYDVTTQTIERDNNFHSYCQTDLPLTSFCTQLTGITQQMCNAGEPFRDVLRAHQKWMFQRGFLDSHNALHSEPRLGIDSDVNHNALHSEPRLGIDSDVNHNALEDVLFLTVGNWDLGTALPNQCRYSGIKVPPYLRSWCDIKTVFKKHYGVKSGGMVKMLAYFNLQLDGRHHSGIDDCYNTARIVDAMIKDGVEFCVTSRPVEEKA